MFASLLKSEPRRAALLMGIWSAAVLGVLQVHRLPALTEHSICSAAWGCGPPVNALLSYHGFWLVLFTAPTWLAVRLLPTSRLKLVGGLLATLGGLAIAGIVLWQVVYWLPSADDFQRRFFVQRCLFKVAVSVDLPAVQATLAGLVCLVVARVQQRRERASDSPANPKASIAGETEPHSPNLASRPTH